MKSKRNAILPMEVLRFINLYGITIDIKTTQFNIIWS